jgi:succinoglycan biosynthesis protein ExoV
LVVFGSGVGYNGPPRWDDTWVVYCVRGPLSADALGLPPDAAVTDPGALIARVGARGTAATSRTARAFMPHWQSQPDDWKRVCDDIGMPFIDPRWPTDTVLDALRRTDLLVTEAMHGAIVADALRIPWIPVRTHAHINSFKWEDWCRSLELEYGPSTLPTIWPELPDAGPIRRARRWAKLALAGRALNRIAAGGRPFLSRADLLDARMDELEQRLEQMRKTELAGQPGCVAS